MPTVRSFRSGDNAYFEYPYSIRGITKDSAGAVLPSCDVTLYRTADDSVSGRAVSDVLGAYWIDASNALFHYAKAYKAGAPDVAGITKNNLVGS